MHPADDFASADTPVTRQLGLPALRPWETSRRKATPKPDDAAGLSGAPSPAHTLRAAEIVARTLRRSIAAGEFKPGDHLPTEAALMIKFEASRATLREALRLLESERLIELKCTRGGALVTAPGPHSVARPFGLLLQSSGATLADLIAARFGMEPAAVKVLARQRSERDLDKLHTLLAQDLPAGWADGSVDVAVAHFHRQLVELAGNAALSVLAAVLDEIIEWHTPKSGRRPTYSQSQYEALIVTFGELTELLRVGDSDGAEAHWRQYIDDTLKHLPPRLARIKVLDIME